MSVQILVRAKIQSAPGNEINDFRTVVIFGMGSHRIDDAEAESMEALETAILARLGYANPYAEAAD